MKCDGCGAEFEEGIFCPECGTKYEKNEELVRIDSDKESEVNSVRAQNIILQNEVIHSSEELANDKFALQSLIIGIVSWVCIFSGGLSWLGILISPLGLYWGIKGKKSIRKNKLAKVGSVLNGVICGFVVLCLVLGIIMAIINH